MTDKLTRADLEAQVEAFRTKALDEHDKVRYWMNRCAEAERQLSDHYVSKNNERKES